MNHISFKTYRTIDLTIWAAILLLFEYITTRAAAKWFPNEIYVISQTAALLCIVMMRWNGYAAVHALTGGIAYCLAAGGRPQQFAVYCIGNCFALTALILFKVIGKEKIRSRWYLSAAFAVAVYCGAQIGRWIVSILLGAPPRLLISFFVTDPVTLMYSIVFVLIARMGDGIFEDQRAYLIRSEAERNAEL